MKLYINDNSSLNLKSLRDKYSSLSSLEAKALKTDLKKLIAQDSENIYCQLKQGETLSFFLRNPQQINFLTKQISQDFDNNSSTLRLSLSELLMNSLEHGNLKIDSDEKNEMIINGSYYDHIDQMIENNADKFIEVEYKLDEPKSIIIKDQGTGFEYKDYLKQHNLEEMVYSGRGIQIASIELPKSNASFEYFEKGTKLIIKFS